MSDEILKKYHVFKEPQKISIRGKALIRMCGKDIDISEFDVGIEFTVSELSKIECVQLLATTFMTIENRTSYLRYKKENTVTFYLGGYANRDQRDFIRKIYESNPSVTYLHFGDIDAGAGSNAGIQGCNKIHAGTQSEAGTGNYQFEINGSVS